MKELEWSKDFPYYYITLWELSGAKETKNWSDVACQNLVFNPIPIMIQM